LAEQGRKIGEGGKGGRGNLRCMDLATNDARNCIFEGKILNEEIELDKERGIVFFLKKGGSASHD
jgi:hypothetical protein